MDKFDSIIAEQVENSNLLQKMIRGLSSAGRASALQAEGHRFEPCRPHNNFICRSGGIGRRKGLKILREQSRAGSSPATSIILLENPQFRLEAEVGSFFRLKYLIVLEGEIFIGKSTKTVESTDCISWNSKD